MGGEGGGQYVHTHKDFIYPQLKDQIIEPLMIYVEGWFLKYADDIYTCMITYTNHVSLKIKLLRDWRLKNSLSRSELQKKYPFRCVQTAVGKVDSY